MIYKCYECYVDYIYLFCKKKKFLMDCSNNFIHLSNLEGDATC